MQRPPAPPVVVARKPKQISTGEIPTWIRIGLPLCLAFIAAALNTLAVKRQITPFQVYALNTSLPIGTRVTSNHLQLIELSGAIDQNVLFTPADLIAYQQITQTPVNLESYLTSVPKILSRSMERGEILTHASFGGRATAQPDSHEEILQVPRNMIRGGGKSLKPGQYVFFLLKQRALTSDDHNQEPIEIGPFRIALQEQTADESTSRGPSEELAVVYLLDAQGKPSPHAQLLQKAVMNDQGSTLAILEKAYRTTTINNAQASVSKASTSTPSTP